MCGRLIPGIFILTCSTSAVAGTPAPNDACVDAVPIIGEGVFAFDNANATADRGSDLAHDVWYCWTSPCGGDVTIDTCGSTAVDTGMGIFDGCQCPPTAWLGFDDDACTYQSSVTFSASAGADYLIQIGSNREVHGDRGTFTIQCGAVPEAPCAQASENCQDRDGWDALASNRTEFVVADDFTSAVDGDLTEICWWGAYSDDGGRDWSVPDSFEVRYYLSDGGLPGALVGGPFSEAEGTLSVQGPTRTYRLLADVAREYEYSATHQPVPVSTGECYWVEINNERADGHSWLWEMAPSGDGRAVQDGDDLASPDGYDPQDALIGDLAFCLNLPLGDPGACRSAPINDGCSDSVPIFEGETFLDTSGATTDGPEHYCRYLEGCCVFPLGDHQIHRDIWFDYAAACSGLLTVGLCDSSFDTKLAVYEGLTCPPADVAVLCDDDGCDEILSQQSQAELLVTQGQGYRIRVGGYTAPLLGDCGIEDLDTPGCLDTGCKAAVCAIDASCCDGLVWDSWCAEIANVVCSGRSGPGTIQLELTAPPAVDMGLADFAFFSACFTGACSGSPCDPVRDPNACCAMRDFDNDGDVDVADYAAFLTGFTGP